MPIVTIQHRPKTESERRRVAEGVIAVVAREWGLTPDRVQVFFHESDDSHWFRG
jgi:phenylpyruvate tautomerase PptA (4-oxalocrotonate tautomerase family)